ncbi:AimR family lysis-lysogeny pheromone receptor [Virgibacillus kekensis]|uniref:AimR family lysis-lysogeny pheromone receptor n=1 Tax=Virgibacillus kekensis TaxID=202261 RepID=A0ABV9DH31_9BACI
MGFSKQDLMPETNILLAGNNQFTLEQVMLILRQDHDDQTAEKLMRQFCLHSTSKEISKKGMEFLYMNGHYEDLKQLIAKNMLSENPSNRDWARVYQLTMDRKDKRYPPREILRQAERMKTDEMELKLLIEFLKISAYYDLNEYREIGNFLDKHQYLFEMIEDRFLLSFFNMRLYQYLFIYFWLGNELIIARKYAFRQLNGTRNPATMASIHVKLGLTYIFDSYFQSMHHTKEALKIAKKHNLPKMIKIIEENNIPFIAAHFKEVDGISTPDLSEQAHIEIAKGNLKKADEILSNITIDSPFGIYYLGMARQDKNILLQAYNNFVEKRSDYFFSRLPLKALKEMGGTPTMKA